jgi:hypothetical protein
MATRGDIKDAFYEALSSVSGSYDVTDGDGNVVETVTLAPEDITLRSPNDEERLPQIVYHDDYRPLRFNPVGSSPDEQFDNGDGTATEIWYDHREALFTIDIRGHDESAKEPIYEAVFDRFGRYRHGAWDSTDFHPDVHWVRANDSVSADTGTVDSTIRGDQIEVRIAFRRSFTRDPSLIEKVDFVVDTDADDIADVSGTVTQS